MRVTLFRTTARAAAVAVMVKAMPLRVVGCIDLNCMNDFMDGNNGLLSVGFGLVGGLEDYTETGSLLH